MAKVDTFTVTVLGWEKHNSKKKKGHQYIMLSTRFFDDSKIERLTPGGRLVYLWMLLRCGQEARGTIEGSRKAVLRTLGGSSIDVSRILSQLVEFQLVRIENSTLIEKKRREEKRKEEKGREPAEPEPELTLLPVVADGPHPLQAIWNEHRGKLPEAKTCTGARKKKADLRWREQPPDAWRETVKKLAESEFCNGKNDRGWRADFDFLLKPETWAKANEGKYDNNRGAHSTQQTRVYDNLDRLEQELTERGER
jgi:hypothetical protein